MLKLHALKPRKFINPLLSKRSVTDDELQKFETALNHYLDELRKQITSRQTEPNIVSNALQPFFNAIGYAAKSYSQKGQSGIDLALMSDHEPSVIIEAKAYGSTAMISQNDLNKKAFHEAILYFMREREKGNRRLFHIIITDFYRWFVFDAKDFEKLFWQNSSFRKIFESVKDPSILGDRTSDFYNMTEKFISDMKSNTDLFEEPVIKCAYFDLGVRCSEKERIALYKLFSKDMLFKQFNPNDANSLNRIFYNEFLYILGLEEYQQGGKKLIGRSRTPQYGSLYENISRKLAQYGKNADFETVIQLMIIWINRILFLKLLESQLIRWNNDPSMAFLNAAKVKDFDKLEMLFFDVLAHRPEERAHREFDYIPYLNSSLFEVHAIEKEKLKISNLEDDCFVPYYKKTVLKEHNGKKKSGEVNTLHYLFEFLDAYDFSSEGNEEVVKEHKSLINASVLGLIFEKLNGYRDGSYYTPSFITMYMSKETIEKAVIDKFNAIKGWNCKTFNDLYDRIDDKEEANRIIDSITICDPAVGSGHFLVSALNTILRIKSELRILRDENGRTLRDYAFIVENDELIVKNDDGEIFEYRRGSREGTRIQKLIFSQKQKIIENSLFGVDINPNSVQITRLRLWIELLKHSYYDENGALVTMPNIDINIKTGNSLISRYDLHDEIDIPNIKHAVKEYKSRVKAYKEGDFFVTKDEIRTAIEDLKAKFGLILKAKWKQTEKLKKLLKQYVTDFGYDGLSDDLILKAAKYHYRQHGVLFDDEKITRAKAKERANLLKALEKCSMEIEEIEKGKIYENAFEWRFEFPEVLDDEGNFAGFDLIIGNPPYFNIDTFGAGSPMLRYLPEMYPDVYMDKSDILFYFIERATALSKSQTAFIVSNALLYSDKAGKLRNYIVKNNPVRKLINFERYQVFDEASITSMMIFLKKQHKSAAKVLNFKASDYDRGWLVAQMSNEENYFEVKFQKNGPFALVDAATAALNEKIDGKHPKLGELFHIGQGMQTAANKVFTFRSYPNEFDERYIKLKMSGKIIEKYIHKEAKEYLLYLEDVEYFEDLPIAVQEYLLEHKEKLSNRAEIKRNENRAWWKYTFPMHKGYYHLQKIWCSYRAKENTFCLDESSDYIGLTNTTVIFGTNRELDLKYILALLNSKLLNFRYKSIGKQTGGGIFEYFENQISKFPIPVIDRSEQEPFIVLIDRIFSLKEAGENTDELENEIDHMVYELYGVDENEIAMIEEMQLEVF